MILAFCDLHLRRIDQQDLELLRQWRNDEKITRHMFFRDYISREMQLDWFASLKENDYYFIIEYKKAALGLINLADFNLEMTRCSAGLFIYNEAYWGGPIPVLASICILDFAFENLKVQEVWAKVQKDNLAARKYNEQLGFVIDSEEWQVLKLNHYKQITSRIKATILSHYNKKSRT